jgi:hypothetical protein
MMWTNRQTVLQQHTTKTNDKWQRDEHSDPSLRSDSQPPHGEEPPLGQQQNSTAGEMLSSEHADLSLRSDSQPPHGEEPPLGHPHVTRSQHSDEMLSSATASASRPPPKLTHTTKNET